MSGLQEGDAPLLSEVEQSRLIVSRTTNSKRKAELGQFFTPAKTARFMAGLFDRQRIVNCRLLDAGAGIGSLSAAFLERWAAGDFDFQRVEVDAFEIDTSLHPYLSQTLDKYGKYLNVLPTIREDDFIHTAADSLSGNFFAETLPQYTHAILNPPYKKIRSDSAHRLALRRVGIETVNLYSAFVALALSLLEDQGQLVAIIPRSFCNGPYYRPFREYMLQRAAIRKMHLFASRNSTFKDDDVLQENLIIMLERGARHDKVTITTSTDDSFSDLETHEYPFDQIVFPEDPDQFIHVPTSPKPTTVGSGSLKCTLEEIDVQVSTGPVVDFRLKTYLRDIPEEDSVPLLYPGHFNGWTVHWPKPELKKPNAIRRTPNTEKWLYPNGFYCVVRRFSSKEERRRVVASVVRPDDFPDTEKLGFENHLNVFHQNKHGLPETLAYGLVVFLNSTAVDETLRCFNGHTQVNATDLRRITYPSRAKLIALGEWAICNRRELSQTLIDEQLENLEHDG
ncbi:MAG: Eco57I restriction-modification methylase domain-containing protein [Anaerolineae bacterium]|nr:Eco57I restriction-modification methylase domain-containing protein [Anaerolineae bacterium]